LIILDQNQRIQGGMFALIADIFVADFVHVWYSGCSIVSVIDGIPEGGTLGTTLFVTHLSARCYRLAWEWELVSACRARGRGTRGRATAHQKQG
jgi:hypothetical protein